MSLLNAVRFPRFSLLIVLGVAWFGEAPDAEAQLFRKNREKNVPPAEQPQLQPGQFEWHPERAPSGPLLLVVSIDDQVAYVYRNGRQIGRSTVSTGREGKETPTGVFTILQKKADHESNIYKGAKMPYMQRLTWSGIALHAGDLPGYPASAGCIRLPYEFSKLIFSATENGTTVVITRRSGYPSQSEKPASILLASQVGQHSMPEPRRPPFWNPGLSLEGPVGLLLSEKDKTIYVYRNGVLIGQSPVYVAPAEQALPAGVFLMLEGTVRGENPVVPGKPIRPWSVLSLEEKPRPVHPTVELRSRVRLPEKFARDVHDMVQPGTILIVTADSSTESTRSQRDFVIMNPQQPNQPSKPPAK